MYSLELGVFMYKYSMNDLPNISNDYFTKRSDIQGYQTRHVNNLNLNKNKKKQKQKQKQNKTKQNKTKQNKTKQNKTKQNKTKQNKTKQKQNKQTRNTLFWSYRPNERSNSILWNNLERKKSVKSVKQLRARSRTVQDSGASSPASANVFVSFGNILSLDCFVDQSVIR